MTTPTTRTPRRYLSPLRYPGGKARMGDYLADMFAQQCGYMDVEVWIEPFAGGLGAGLHLLSVGAVEEVWFCEANPALAAMWRALIADPERLASRVEQLTPTLGLFEDARAAVAAATAAHAPDDETLALSALVMNRCSRSGMVAPTVGPIGGKAQTGRYTVASRFHPHRLPTRLRDLAPLASGLRYVDADGIDYINGLDGSVGLEQEVVILADPPYSDVGGRLYTYGMSPSDHQRLAWALNTTPCRWALTYDSTPTIARDWYPDCRVMEYTIRHGANQHHTDTEYLILSDNLIIDPTATPLPNGTHTWVRDEADLAATPAPLTLPIFD